MGALPGRRTRRLWSDEEKRSICLQTTASDVSVAQVARRYAMNANLISAWLRDALFAPGEAQAAGGASCFLPVEIVAEVLREDERRINNDGQIEVDLAGGHRLRISGSYDPEALAADASAPTAKQPTAVPAAGGDNRVEITLPNGRKIALGIAVDPMALVRLMQVLDRA